MQINKAANFPSIFVFFVSVNTLQHGGNKKTRTPLFFNIKNSVFWK